MSSQPFSLHGKRALVTGGAKGIGRACAEALAKAGATVVIADVDPSAGQQTAKDLGGTFHRLDVTDRAAIEALAQELKSHHGPLDILVNNAGIVHNAPSEALAEQDWRRVMDVNLNGVFYCAQGFGRHMVEAGRGSIVSISSICGSVAVYPQPQAAYNAAKAGVNLLTKSLAVEWARKGVRVNAVAPGYIASSGMDNYPVEAAPLIRAMAQTLPLGRFGTEAEVAAAIVYLLSPAASFVSGMVLRVDGARPQARMGYPMKAADAKARERGAIAPFNGFHRARLPKVFAGEGA